MKRITLFVVLVLSSVLGAACTPAPTAVPPTSTPVPPTPTPTTIPTPTPTPGALAGTLVGMDSGKPLAYAAIDLCRVLTDSCMMKSDLTTRTKPDGRFEFKQLPPAKYVVLYNPQFNDEDIDGRTIDLSKKSMDCLHEATGGLTPVPPPQGVLSCPGYPAQFFGEPDLLRMSPLIKITKSGFWRDSSIYSLDYRVYLNFQDGDPLSVVITPGGMVEILIRAWNN